jgi:hypothetical protein
MYQKSMTLTVAKITALMTILFFFTVATSFARIDADISESTFVSAGPQTLTGYNVYVPALNNGLFTATYQWDADNITWVMTAYTRTGTKGAGDTEALTNAKKLAGTWTFVYTLSTSTFTDTCVLDTILTSDPNSEGGLFVLGTDEYGGTIAGSHFPDSGFFMVLDPGTIIDQVYIFDISGNNTTDGQYMLYSHSREEWSNLYSMNGVKTPLTPIITNDIMAAAMPSVVKIYANPAIGLAAQKAAESEVFPTMLDANSDFIPGAAFVDAYDKLNDLVSGPR